MFSGVLAYGHFVICMAKRKPSDRKLDFSNSFRLMCRKRTDYLKNMSHASMGTYRSHTWWSVYSYCNWGLIAFYINSHDILSHFTIRFYHPDIFSHFTSCVFFTLINCPVFQLNYPDIFYYTLCFPALTYCPILYFHYPGIFCYFIRTFCNKYPDKLPHITALAVSTATLARPNS
jgi:hypothetical protein